MKEALKKLKTGDIQTRVDRMLYKYRITPHTATGKSPAQMMFKREIRTPFHLLQPSSQVHTVKSKAQTEKRKARSFEQGDLVWAKNFRPGEKWIAGIIVRKLGNVTYEVEGLGNRHIDHLTKRQEGGDRALQESREAERCKKIVPSDFEVEVTEVYGNNPPYCTQPNPHDVPLRRSARACKKPAWTTDFVTN